MRITFDLRGACAFLGITREDSEADILRKYERLLERYNPKKIEDREIPERVKSIGRYKFAGYKVAYKTISKYTIDEVLQHASGPDHRENVVIHGCKPSNKGALKWSVKLDASVVLSPAIGDGLLFVPCTDKHLYAVDASDGKIKWKFHAGSKAAPSTPCVAGRDVYFTTEGEYVFAMDASVPSVKWICEGILPTAEVPVLHEGRLYIGTMDHHVVALDQDTGAVVSKWNAAKGIIGVPRIIDGVLYFSTYPTRESMERVYLEAVPRKKPLQISGPARSSPVGEGNIVCYATIHGQLHAVDVSNDREIWTLPTSETFSVNPIVERGTLISTMRHTDLYGVELQTGAVLWRFKVGDLRHYSPLASEGMVSIGSSDGHVIVAEAMTGEEIMWFRTGSPVTSPAICGDTVFFGSKDKQVFAVTIRAET